MVETCLHKISQSTFDGYRSTMDWNVMDWEFGVVKRLREVNDGE